jgi:two-component system cell cycle response regulator DivK
MVYLKQLATHMTDWTVLIVDDEPDSLDVAGTLLEMAGVSVLTASNGKEGLEHAKTHRPNFIISDLSMPEMSGWEMLKHLKEDLATRNIPVIALTAHAMRGDRNRAVAAGFHNYMSKPLRPETFVHDLLKLLADIPQMAGARVIANDQGEPNVKSR